MRLTVVLFFALTLVGCYANLTDKTPPAFPMDYTRDQANTPAGNPAATWYWSGSENDRFKLMVGSGSLVRNVMAFVTVNAHEFPMSRTGPSDLFSYDATDLCQPSYNYSFRVTYSVAGASETARLPGDGSTRHVDVSKFGNVIWLSRLNGAHTLGDGTQTLRFVAETETVHQVVTVRNLSTSPLDLYNISLVSAVGATDNSQFSVTPSLTPGSTSPLTLNCGGEVQIMVDWNGACGSCSAHGALGINGMLRDGAGSGWNLLLFLVGDPRPS